MSKVSLNILFSFLVLIHWIIAVAGHYQSKECLLLDNNVQRSGPEQYENTIQYFEGRSTKKKKRRKKKPYEEEPKVTVKLIKPKRKKKRKMMKKLIIPILIGLLVVKSLILPVILKTLAVMSTIAIVLSLLGFITSKLVAAKLLLEGVNRHNDKTSVEIIKIPHSRADYEDTYESHFDRYDKLAGGKRFIKE